MHFTKAQISEDGSLVKLTLDTEDGRSGEIIYLKTDGIGRLDTIDAHDYNRIKKAVFA
jgi:hypothetical protein